MALETDCWMDVITSSTINQYISSGPHAHDCLNNHEVESTQELLKYVSLGLTVSFRILSHLTCPVTQLSPTGSSKAKSLVDISRKSSSLFFLYA
jgi:hypothetical protein